MELGKDQMLIGFTGVGRENQQEGRVAALKNHSCSRHAVELHLETDLALMQAVLCMQKACSSVDAIQSLASVLHQQSPPRLAAQACWCSQSQGLCSVLCYCVICDMSISLETRAFCSISTNDYGKNQLTIIYQRLLLQSDKKDDNSHGRWDCSFTSHCVLNVLSICPWSFDIHTLYFWHLLLHFLRQTKALLTHFLNVNTTYLDLLQVAEIRGSSSAQV